MAWEGCGIGYSREYCSIRVWQVCVRVLCECVCVCVCVRVCVCACVGMKSMSTVFWYIHSPCSSPTVDRVIIHSVYVCGCVCVCVCAHDIYMCIGGEVCGGR